MPTVSRPHRHPGFVVVLAAAGLGVVYLLVAPDPASAGSLKDMADRMKSEMIAVAVAFAVTALIVVAAFLGALRKFPALALAILYSRRRSRDHPLQGRDPLPRAR